MKNWYQWILGTLVGVIAVTVIFFVASPPRGTAILLQPAPTPAPIVIHIGGAVMHPGVYSFANNSRVQDAITASGGFSAEADQDVVNLAARLRDGDQIIVPVKGVSAPLANPEVRSPGQIDTAPTKPVNINTASSEELQTLPGIGETRAKDIIVYRETHGGFKTIEQIMEVAGIGEATFDRLKDLITVQ